MAVPVVTEDKKEEEGEKKLNIQRITGEECESTRPLWEEVFREDSKKFLDYYYQYKAPGSIGYVEGKYPYKAMMFRNLYELMVQKQKREISYLVAVATRKEYRHQGLMTALLMESFHQMYKEKNPFTFLMPADPAIYEPFDFSYVYEREVWEISGQWADCLEGLWEIPSEEEQKEKQEDLPRLRAASHEEPACDLLKLWVKESGCDLLSVRKKIEEGKVRTLWEEIIVFSHQWLSKRYEVYTYRSRDYYERQIKELLSQNGDIFVAKKEGRIEGIFLYAREGEEISIQEVMESREGLFSFFTKQEKTKPIIMARIIHLEEMLKLVRCSERKSILMEVEDPLIPQNEGVYRVEMTPRGSSVVKLEEPREAEEYWHIKELAPKLLRKVFLNEIV